MRSKKKKLLFVCFSALIMIGLCIGAFADYNSDRVGTVIAAKPFDCGDLLVDFDTESSFTVQSGYYILHVNYKQSFDILSNIDLVVFNNDQGYLTLYNSQYSRINVVCLRDPRTYAFLYEYGDYYIYCYFDQNYTLSKFQYYNSDFVSVQLYSISDDYTIDIYDNSQDVWSSIVSVVNDATDSIINTDILLLFAAALPVISIGIGFLIRLFHKS